MTCDWLMKAYATINLLVFKVLQNLNNPLIALKWTSLPMPGTLTWWSWQILQWLIWPFPAAQKSSRIDKRKRRKTANRVGQEICRDNFQIHPHFRVSAAFNLSFDLWLIQYEQQCDLCNRFACSTHAAENCKCGNSTQLTQGAHAKGYKVYKICYCCWQFTTCVTIRFPNIG